MLMQQILVKKNLVLYRFKKVSDLGADLQLFSVKVSLSLFRNNISRASPENYSEDINFKRKLRSLMLLRFLTSVWYARSEQALIHNYFSKSYS